MTNEPFGETTDGVPVQRYILTNAHGMTMAITNYGCIVTSLTAPDRDGTMADVVLGFDTLADYQKDTPYFGAIVGRYGNRIAHGRFTLDDHTYDLATNNEPAGIPCALHGGLIGFDKVVWDAEPVTRDGLTGLALTRTSPDGEEGYPGNLKVTITHWLTDANELRIEYTGTTDKATPVNLTHHGYFNLAGHNGGTILDHEMMIAADHIVPVSPGLIPTGDMMPVEGTPFDFRTPMTLGARIDAPHPQLEYGAGYDHTFVLTPADAALKLAARVTEPRSGRVMDVLTTEPGVQLYCGNFLDGSHIGKGGHAYARRTGFCLETQHFPDSPNQPAFPSTILRPGNTYRQETVYRFGTA